MVSQTKKMIDEEDLGFSSGGAARKQRHKFESGELVSKPQKLIEKEDLNVSSGAASEQKELFESGRLGSETKKMIEDEELGVTLGTTSEQKELFESGKLVTPPKRCIDDEELPGSNGPAAVVNGNWHVTRHLELVIEHGPCGSVRSVNTKLQIDWRSSHVVCGNASLDFNFKYISVDEKNTENDFLVRPTAFKEIYVTRFLNSINMNTVQYMIIHRFCFNLKLTWLEFHKIEFDQIVMFENQL